MAKSENSKKASKIKIKITPENKCSFCDDRCCSYYTSEVEAPRSIADFDHLLWQMAHANTAVYQDDDGWYLLVYNRCQHLLPSGGCGIYETRPQVCRDYDNDWCEYDEPAEQHFKKFFDSYQALDQFCRKKFKSWDKRFEKK